MAKASEFTCTDEGGCKRRAAVFVGIADPDMPHYPMCKYHAAVYRMTMMFASSPSMNADEAREAAIAYVDDKRAA